MADMNESDFKEKGSGLLKNLEERAGKLRQTEASVDDILQSIAEARDELRQQNASAALKKYNEILESIRTAEVSLCSYSLACRLLWVEVGYLLVLVALGYATYKYPSYNLWDGLVTRDFIAV